MATDHKTSTYDSQISPGSAIENELPTYRALSSRAVFSFLCGLLALFSFAHPFFYLFAALAVILGISADRKIQRYSEILTGRRLAQAGIAMGLVFGLSIATITMVQTFIQSREAAKFARYYGELLKKGSLADILWIGMPPQQRKSVSPQQVIERMQSAKSQELAMMEMKNAPLKAIKKRLSSSNQEDIHFVKLEGQTTEHLNVVAFALFEVHGPGTKDFPEKEEYALAVLKGVPKGKDFEWWVDDLRYPYKPSSFVISEKPVDDGHGHAH